MPDFSFEAKDQRWHLSALSLGDMRRFKEWVQLRPWFALQNQRDRIPPDLFDKESARLLQSCMDKEIKEGSPEVAAEMETSEGVTQLVYLSLRRNHPAITPDQVEDLLTTRNIKEVSDLLVAVSGLAKKNEIATETINSILESSISPVLKTD
jgi:hypothetical protein